MCAFVFHDMKEKGQCSNLGALFSKVCLLNFQKTACSVAISQLQNTYITARSLAYSFSVLSRGDFMVVLYSLIACCIPRNGLRWTGRWGWSLRIPGCGLGSNSGVFWAVTGIVSSLPFFDLYSCLLRQEAFLYLSPPFFLDSSRDPSVAFLFVCLVSLVWVCLFGFFLFFSI